MAAPFAQEIELFLQDRHPSQGNGGQRTRPSHDHAEAPQRQTSGHRLAQMRKSLANDVVPLIKSRKAGHGFSPVSRSVYYNSAYQNHASPHLLLRPKDLRQKGVPGWV